MTQASKARKRPMGKRRLRALRKLADQAMDGDEELYDQDYRETIERMGRCLDAALEEIARCRETHRTPFP